MTHQGCKVSVILPTYNRSSLLPASCESVLTQSYKSLELIVVDDGSTEDVRSVVEALADPRLVYVRRDQNGGASAARNTGLAYARGDFIAFQDSDDLWLPKKLARQIELFDMLPEKVGAVFGSKILYGRDAHYRYGSGRVTCMPPPEGRLRLDEDQARRFLMENRISLQNALFQRDCLGGTMEWFDTCAKANADWEFTARLGQVAKIYEDPEPVVVAFISKDSISKRPSKKILGLLRILSKNRSAFERYPKIKAQLMVKISTELAALGKSKLSLRFMLAAARRNPFSVFSAGGALKRLMASQAADIRGPTPAKAISDPGDGKV